MKYSGLISNRGSLQLFGKLLPQVGREVFGLIRFVLEPSWQSFSIVGGGGRSTSNANAL